MNSLLPPVSLLQDGLATLADVTKLANLAQDDLDKAQVEAQLNKEVLQHLSLKTCGPKDGGRHCGSINGHLCTKANHDFIWQDYDKVTFKARRAAQIGWLDPSPS